MKIKKSLVELPKKGKALIITDIHGNLADFEKYMKIWRDFKSNDNHLILTGDYIHAMFNAKDDSIKILDSVKWNCGHSKNFHALLGNHEWSHVSGEAVYKAGINQKNEFELQLERKFGIRWNHKLDLYINFFRKLPLAVRTENGVFISHASPGRNIKNIDDIINVTDNGYGINNENLFGLLWNRYSEDYYEEEIDFFLEKLMCKVSVVGHTPFDGYRVVGNQIVLSSSFGLGKKCYIELDLEKEIKEIGDVIKMIKYL